MNEYFLQKQLMTLQNIFHGKIFTQVNVMTLQIIILIFILIWILKKLFLLNKNNIQELITIISKKYIGSNESIVIIELKDVRLVLGVTKNSINILHKITIFEKKLEKKIVSSNLLGMWLIKLFKTLWNKLMIYRIISFFVLFLCSPIVHANIIEDGIHHILSDSNNNWSFPIQSLLFITALTFLPAFFLMMTSFTRIIIVFGFLRSALGTPYAPPNQVLLGLALFLTFFIMSPVCDKIYEDAYIPFSENKINMEMAIEKGILPIKKFMINQTRQSDLESFAKLANISGFLNKDNIPMRIVLPSFMISELKTAFQIGFTIFIPFLIIDLVVASVLMALGMMMVPPSTISLPFKLMLFILVDGWQLLVNSLSQSFFLN